MKILLATTEAVPFAKTGGLADVCGTLPSELAKLGHQVVVIMPAFRQIFQTGLEIADTRVGFTVPIGGKTVRGNLLRGQLPGSSVPVYFVEQDDYYNREQLYRAEGEDYRDNCERFVFFCRAVLEAIRLLDLQIDILHCNDWQTGLLPAYLKTKPEYQSAPYDRIRTLLTIHNLAYQGVFWHWDMELTGMDWRYFNWRQMEFYGKLNLLKTGIAFADRINTVSPRYAEEIQTPALGCGLEGLLAHRRNDLTGIINGVDYQEWNPATDKFLPEKYDVESVTTGKAKCKQTLQDLLGLPVQTEAPLIGVISRLADQKGFDLIEQVMQNWVHTSTAQWVILGTGEPRYHDALRLLADRFPDKVAVRLEFSNPLAHQIEAGADIFLMPSQYEPCGLNQLYSLRYGTVPVVRATGGLADTVTNTTPETIADQTATGFSFRDYNAQVLSSTLWRACDAYLDQRLWHQLVTTGMRQDWSWSRSAKRYSDLYEQTARLAAV